MLISGLLTSGISILVFPFFYNNIYIKGQIDKGWQPVNEEGKVYVQKIYDQNTVTKIIKFIFIVSALFVLFAFVSALIKYFG